MGKDYRILIEPGRYFERGLANPPKPPPPPPPPEDEKPDSEEPDEKASK